MRVHELAKNLGIKSRDLIEQMARMKIAVTTASSSVDDKDAKRLKEFYENRQDASPAEDGADVQSEIEQLRSEVKARKDAEKELLSSKLEAARQRIKKQREQNKQQDSSEDAADETQAGDAADEETQRKLKAARLIAKLKGKDLPPGMPPAATRTQSAPAHPAEARAPRPRKDQDVPQQQQKQDETRPPVNFSPIAQMVQKTRRFGDIPIEDPDARKPKREDRRRKKKERGEQRGEPRGEHRGEQRGGDRKSEEKVDLAAVNIPVIDVMKMDKDHRGRRRGPAGGETAGGDKGGRRRKGRVKPTRIITEKDVGFEDMPTGTGPVRGQMRKRKPGAAGQQPIQPSAKRDEGPRQVRMAEDLTLGEFADKISVPVNEVMRTLLMMGEMATINDVLTPDSYELIATEHNVELEFIPDTDANDVAELMLPDNPENLSMRPPIVTVMGHVDHGKTSLMDAFRKSDIAGGEVGGITQSIGAYDVHTPHGAITFIDTPGHEAFTAMRARGAGVTDVVVLVVAADDGVMPQTVEAINHAKAAKVPIIVAINKIDKAESNIGRVRNELMHHEIVPEDLGGENLFVEVSAKTRQGIDKLLEHIALQSEVLELTADTQRPAEGTIIESHVDPNRGAVATVLVQKGTLKLGDPFVAGTVSGRVRRMRNEHGELVQEAGPSKPVELIGVSGCPDAGEKFIVVKDERVARDVAEKRMQRRRKQSLRKISRVTLENLHEHIEEGKVQELDLILKADMQGSVEAVKDSLNKLPQERVKVNFIHMGVGAISESDVTLAMATNSIIIGFNVRAENNANLQAQAQGVEIRTYRIIYKLVEDIEKALVGMLEPVYKENFRGRANVLKTFKVSKVGNVAGCMVLEGELQRGAQARLVRDSVTVYEGKLSSLRRVKDDVSSVVSGLECGVQLENYQDVKEGDVIECFELEEIKQTL
ncbi:translation initiation factor IF-2 [Candidatus Sumerlaeota bacterium]|nr:translation initiation factor IF-2 [Candidatus Sumerlaeota bacterium]